jgi:hypothetical protein
MRNRWGPDDTQFQKFQIWCRGGAQATPTVTHSLTTGQHVWPLGHGAVAEHKKPGFVSVRQCLAAGQQNSVALHAAGGVHAAPGVTQSLVRGQQTSPVGHVEPALAQGILLAVRQCLASGQQGQRFLI